MMEMASASLTRVTLELGGNDAAIVLKDAILDDVHLDRLFAAIYDTTGQICMNAKRLFVHTSRVDEIVKGLSARLQKVKLGYGLDKDTTMGPLHSTAPSRRPRTPAPKSSNSANCPAATCGAATSSVRPSSSIPT